MAKGHKSKQGVTINLASGTEFNTSSAGRITGAPGGDGYVTPEKAMLVGENGWGYLPLVTIGETISGTTGALNSTSAGNYTPVGILDGIGAHQLDSNTVRVFVNHELGPTTGAAYSVFGQGNQTYQLTGARVSYFDINIETKAIEDAGIAYDRIYGRDGNLVTNASQLDSGVGFSRFCSSVTVEKDTFGAGRGVTETIYFTNEETDNGSVWALDVDTGDLWAVPEFGRGGWENVSAVDTGNTTHVAFMISDDTAGAPMYLYVGKKIPGGDFLERNGLAEGQLYVWKANTAGVNTAGEHTAGTIGGTWVPINAQDVSKAGQAGYDDLGYKDQDTLYAEADALGAFHFSRPEDVAYNPNDGTQVVMASTGNTSLENGNDGTDAWGIVYVFDNSFSGFNFNAPASASNAPTSSLRVLYNGNTDTQRQLRSADNLDWADDGFIYVNEDRSVNWAGTPNTNEASIVRIDPNTAGNGNSAVVRVAEVDRSAVGPFGRGVTDSSPTDFGNWESSGVLDVSKLFGEPGGSVLITDVQAHSLRNGVIGGNAGLVQGGQLGLLVNTPAAIDWKPATGNVATGTKFDDVLLGNNNNNTLNGGKGHDVLRGFGGNDTMTGGTGEDIFKYGAGDQADVITDFDASPRLDRIDLTAFRFANVAAARAFATLEADGDVFFNFGNGDTLLVDVVGRGLTSIDQLTILI